MELVIMSNTAELKKDETPCVVPSCCCPHASLNSTATDLQVSLSHQMLLWGCCFI